MKMIRFRYACDFKVSFWAWRCYLGIGRMYYDGWNNYINLGLIAFSWKTPPLIGDNKFKSEF
jgi:hypothetical protein